MSVASSRDRVSATCGRYIDDFTRLFRFHQISTGKPQDFARLASLLATNEALSSDFYSLVLSILHREDGGLSETDILTAVAFALGGNDIATKGEVAIPLDLLSNFTAGLTSWTDALNNQPDLYDPPELRPVPPPQPLPSPAQQTAAPEATPATAPEAPASPPMGAEAEALLAPPLVTKLTGTLDRLELDSLELKHHLEVIERRISQIEPHLQSSAAAPLSEPRPTATQQATAPPSSVPSAPSAPPRPHRTASGSFSFTFTKAMDAAHVPISPAEPDAPVAPKTLAQPAAKPIAHPAPTSIPIPPATPTTLQPNPAPAPSLTPIPKGQSLQSPPPITSERTSTLPTPRPYVALAATPPRERSPYISPETSPVVQRLRAAVIALGVVLLLALGAAGIFAYRFYSTRAPQPQVARIAPATPATSAAPLPQSKPAPAPSLRPHPAHPAPLQTQHDVEEVETETAPGGPIAAPYTTRPATSNQTTSSATTSAMKPVTTSAPHATTPATPTAADHFRSSTSTPIAVEPVTLASSLPQVSPATVPPMQQHTTLPASPAVNTSSSVASSTAQPTRPAADTSRTSSAPILGPVSVPSDVMMRNVISSQNPIYPPEAKAFRIEGSVIVQIVISKTGSVQAAKAIKGPLQLQLSAVNAVRAWRFRPYLVEGQPMEVNTYIRFNYNAR